MPGLINSINPKIPVGGATFLFDIAWIFGVRIFQCAFLVISFTDSVGNGCSLPWRLGCITSLQLYSLPKKPT